MKTICRVLIAIMVPLVTSGTQAADVEQDRAVERGNAHYLLFCANCHGVDGDGQGPLVGLLKVVPSDLRYLQQRGGDLAEQVLKALDGRHKVGEGAERKMPVFTQNLEVRTIIEITDYLRTIQK
jgi:mono/diheme cytochrome c family protein